MSINEFEKEIKGRLTDYESVIDAEALWDDLQPLEEKNNRKFFLWFFLGMVSLLMMVGGYLFINNSQENTISQTRNKTAKTEQLNDSKLIENKSTGDKKNQNIDTKEPKQKESKKVNSKENQQTKNTTKKNSSKKIKENQTRSIKEDSKANQRFSTSDRKIITPPLATTSSTKSDNSPKNVTTIPSTIKEDLTTSNATTGTSKPNTPIPISVNTITPLPSLLDHERKEKKLRLGDPVLLKINPLMKRWELVFSFMPEYAFRNLSSTADNQFRQIHVNRRLASEFYEFSHKSGIELRHQTKKGMRFSAGVNYGQLTEVLNNVNDLGTVTISDTSYIDKIVKLTETTFDTIYGGSQTLRQFHIRKIYNKYRTINIPVSIGMISQKNAWTYGFDAGASFNLSFSQKGQILNIEGDETTSLENTESFFNDNIGITLFAGVALGYNIGRNINLELAPRFSYGLNNWTNVESGFDTRYNHLGIKFGIAYKL